MIYLLASLQIRHDPSVHADPGRIFLHLQKQMSYLWVSTAHNRSYQDATTITKAERINIAITRDDALIAAMSFARCSLGAVQIATQLATQLATRVLDSLRR